jgi:hypothetical protein
MWENEYGRLVAMLVEAEAHSPLPLESTMRAPLDEFLKRLRLGEL